VTEALAITPGICFEAESFPVANLDIFIDTGIVVPLHISLDEWTLSFKYT